MSSLTASKYLSLARQCEKKPSQIYTSDYQRKRQAQVKIKIDTGVARTLCQYVQFGRCAEINARMLFRKHTMYEDSFHWLRHPMPGKYPHQHQKASRLYICQILRGGRTISITSKKQADYISAKFYVVGVPRPAMTDLPTCERLELITINCNSTNNEPAARVIVPTADLKSVQGLKTRTPNS